MQAAPQPQDKKPQVPTLADYYATVFSPLYVESAVAASSAAKYTNNFAAHILPALGAFRLDEIEHDRMEEFIAKLVKDRLAKATIETIVSNLRTFFNHARKRKLIIDNPASGLSRLYSQAKTKHDKIEPLTREEVPLFLAAVAKYSPQNYALFVTAVHTGARQGELAGLQTGDIDLHGKYLVIQRSIDRVHRKVVPTKTKRIRRVDLSNELCDVLKDHIRRQKEFWFREGKPQPEWLFPNSEGGWFDAANLVDRHFHRCLEKAGLHRRRFHDMRHGFASLLLTSGAPIQYVSDQMGHSSIQLTVKLYGHLQPGANQHWMNSLPGISAPAKAVAAD